MTNSDTIELLASAIQSLRLAGFFSSFIPEIFNFLKDKKDKEHELKLINLQIEAMKTCGTSKLEETIVQANIQESKYLYYHAGKSGKIAVNSSIINCTASAPDFTSGALSKLSPGFLNGY